MILDRFYYSGKKKMLKNTMHRQIFRGPHKYIWNDIQTDREIKRQLLLFVESTINLFCKDLPFDCLVSKLSTKVTPPPLLHAQICTPLEPTSDCSWKRSLMINLLYFKCRNVYLDEFPIHTHLCWHNGNVIVMNWFGQNVWRPWKFIWELKMLECLGRRKT
jgi:hypothetical protein